MSERTSRREQLETSRTGRGAYVGVGIVFLWFLLGATALYVFFFSPFLLIEQPGISGSQNIPEEKVRQFLDGRISGKYFGIVPRNSFFVVRPETLERLLMEEFPLLRSVTAIRTFPNDMRVELSERDKILLWCSGDDCYVLAEDGTLRESSKVFASEENLARTIRVTDLSAQPVAAGQRIAESDFMVFATSAEFAFRERLDIGLENAYSTASRFAGELRVRTGQGYEVYLNTTVPLEDSLDALALLFEKEVPEERRGKLRYVDLRTENRIYYAFQDGEQQEVQPVAAEESKAEEKKSEEKKKKKR